jgi:hypothetical protein
MRALSLVVAHRGFFLAFGAIPLLMALTTALETRQYLPAWRRRIFAGRKLFGHSIDAPIKNIGSVCFCFRWKSEGLERA